MSFSRECLEGQSLEAPPFRWCEGLVWVEKKRVASILRYGYMSVHAQLEHELVTERELYEKYGQQFERAKREEDGCPPTLLEYLRWRAGEEGKMEGEKAIFFLKDWKLPASVPDDFTRTHTVCLSLRWPNTRDWPVYAVPAHETEGEGRLWFSGVEHGYVVAPDGIISPKHVRVVCETRV